MEKLIKISKKYSVNITLVFANKYCEGLSIAQKNKILTICIEKNSYLSKISYEMEIIKLLMKHEINLVFLAGFMYVFSEYMIKTYKGNLINIHPSLLPSYKGLNTHTRVILDNQKYHGATVHLINKNIDDGPIIAQAITNVENFDTPKSLEKKILKIEHQLYPSILISIISGNLLINSYKIFWKNKSCLPNVGESGIIRIIAESNSKLNYSGGDK